MKGLIVAAAAVAISCGYANGADKTMTADFVGDWCSPFREGMTRYYTLPDEDKCTDILSIDKYGFRFDSEEIHCKPVNIRLGKKTAQSGITDTATVTARCQPDGPATAGTLRSFKFSRYKGSLNVTTLSTTDASRLRNFNNGDKQ
jgi:hypothetical protein